MMLAACAIMITGGTCGSGLMIITVTRYIREKEHAWRRACMESS